MLNEHEEVVCKEEEASLQTELPVSCQDESVSRQVGFKTVAFFDLFKKYIGTI